VKTVPKEKSSAEPTSAKEGRVGEFQKKDNLKMFMKGRYTISSLNIKTRKIDNKIPAWRATRSPEPKKERKGRHIVHCKRIKRETIKRHQRIG